MIIGTTFLGTSAWGRHFSLQTFLHVLEIWQPHADSILPSVSTEISLAIV